MIDVLDIISSATDLQYRSTPPQLPLTLQVISPPTLVTIHKLPVITPGVRHMVPFPLLPDPLPNHVHIVACWSGLRARGDAADNSRLASKYQL
jgi:hypothetical protein